MTTTRITIRGSDEAARVPFRSAHWYVVYEAKARVVWLSGRVHTRQVKKRRRKLRDPRVKGKLKNDVQALAARGIEARVVSAST